MINNKQLIKIKLGVTMNNLGRPLLNQNNNYPLKINNSFQSTTSPKKFKLTEDSSSFQTNQNNNHTLKRKNLFQPDTSPKKIKSTGCFSSINYVKPTDLIRNNLHHNYSRYHCFDSKYNEFQLVEYQGVFYNTKKIDSIAKEHNVVKAQQINLEDKKLIGNEFIIKLYDNISTKRATDLKRIYSMDTDGYNQMQTLLKNNPSLNLKLIPRNVFEKEALANDGLFIQQIAPGRLFGLDFNWGKNVTRKEDLSLDNQQLLDAVTAVLKIIWNTDNKLPIKDNKLPITDFFPSNVSWHEGVFHFFDYRLISKEDENKELETELNTEMNKMIKRWALKNPFIQSHLTQEVFGTK